jgi:hypothetical protein
LDKKPGCHRYSILQKYKKIISSETTSVVIEEKIEIRIV